MQKAVRGFTLIELITVIILIGIMSITLFSRLGSVSSTNVNASRDDLIAALFFAQQTAMARNNIKLVVSANSVSVTENDSPIVVYSNGYPLHFASGVTATQDATFVYDKLGRINNISTNTTITLSSTSGPSAAVIVEASGYAH